MSEINYFGIEEAVAQEIRDGIDETVFGKKVTVEVESNPDLISAKSPYVHIGAKSYETPQDQATIGGNNPYRTFFTVSVFCYFFALEAKVACRERDKLLRKVKEIIKELARNCTIDGVEMITFNGGEFTSDINETNGFFKGVEIEIQMEVRE